MEVLDQPTQLKLLFRASEYQFSSQSFHNKCDDTEDTLTLILTEHGKTIGGFTHYKWNEVSNKYVRGDRDKAFLIQLDRKEKMVPQEENHLIYCSREWGPSFGDDDIFIDDSCHKNENSCAFFPNSYNREGKDQYERGQDSYKRFSGAI